MIRLLGILDDLPVFRVCQTLAVLGYSKVYNAQTWHRKKKCTAQAQLGEAHRRSCVLQQRRGISTGVASSQLTQLCAEPLDPAAPMCADTQLGVDLLEWSVPIAAASATCVDAAAAACADAATAASAACTDVAAAAACTHAATTASAACTDATAAALLEPTLELQASGSEHVRGAHATTVTGSEHWRAAHGTPAEGSSRDTAHGTPAGGSSRDAANGTPAEAASRDAANGTPAEAAIRDAAKGTPAEAASRNATNGSSVEAASTDADSARFEAHLRTLQTSCWGATADVLRRYLVTAAAKDCSVILSLRRAPTAHRDGPCGCSGSLATARRDGPCGCSGSLATAVSRVELAGHGGPPEPERSAREASVQWPATGGAATSSCRIGGPASEHGQGSNNGPASGNRPVSDESPRRAGHSASRIEGLARAATGEWHCSLREVWSQKWGRFEVSVGVVDLDCKPLSKVAQHWQLDRDIVALARQRQQVVGQASRG